MNLRSYVLMSFLILGSGIAELVITVNAQAISSALAANPNPNPSAAAPTAAAAGASNPAATTSTTAAAGAAAAPTGGAAPAAAAPGGSAAPAGKIQITKEEFSKAVEDCYPENKPKYTPDVMDAKYKAFMSGLAKSTIDSKKEAAMFLAQILHESGGLIYTKEIVCQTNLAKCKTDYPPKGPGKSTNKDYYGRGYIQLTWDDNYLKASMALFNDDRLVKDPDQVADKEEVAWGVSFYYWDDRVHKAPGVKEGKFGAATNAINGPLECVAKSNPNAVVKRNTNYGKCLKAFGLNDAPDTSGC